MEGWRWNVHIDGGDGMLGMEGEASELRNHKNTKIESNLDLPPSNRDQNSLHLFFQCILDCRIEKPAMTNNGDHVFV